MQTRVALRPRARARLVALSCAGIAALICLAGCKETSELYCCSTLGSCKSSGSSKLVPCTDPARPFCDDQGEFAASDGIRNTCIPDPNPSECESAEECTDPARPLCEDGRCVACAGPSDCGADAPVCNTEAGECVGCSGPEDCAGRPDTAVCASDGSCVGCVEPSDCDAAAPICDDDSRACRACAAHDECASGACDLVAGACAAEAEVLYVSSDGGGTDCSRPLPCASLSVAAAASSRTRQLVRMAAGTYTGTTALSGVTLRVFADPGTVLRPTPGGSVTVEVSGASEVLLHGVEVSGATADTGARALRCVDVDGSPTLTLVRSVVKDAPGLGIESSNCTLAIERSEISGNTGGGVSASGGRFTLLNNFLTQNGASASLVGGASLSGSADSRFEHNTVTANVRGAASVAGVTCVGALVARNNIIYAKSNGAAEVSNECTHRFSLIGPEPEDGEGNLADPPAFVDPTAGDFHLTPASAGVDDAETSSVPDDFDGDARPQGPRSDMGADEVPAR
jgi:hypothetical protein